MRTRSSRKLTMENLDARCLMTVSTFAELPAAPVAEVPADDPWVTFCLINSEPGEDLANCLDGLPSHGKGDDQELVKSVPTHELGPVRAGGISFDLDDDWCGTGPKIDIPLPGPIGPWGWGIDFYPNPEDDDDLGPIGPVAKGALDRGFQDLFSEFDDDWCGTGPKIDIPLPGPIGPKFELGGDFYPNPEDDDDLGPIGPIADLESQDKLGNFEIQDLMSRFNQSESLASSVAKQLEQTNSTVIGKIG